MDRVECVVVGAGVVGLAVARGLARAGREVIVLEAERLIGSHTSARNSEVIHAGIYYPKGSAKARLCVRGREMLYAYCESRGVPHRRLGKIIVATAPEQEGELAGIAAAAAANGVDDLRPLGGGGAPGDGAGARGGRRAALALDRDHRQPCADARLPGRARGRRRGGGARAPASSRRDPFGRRGAASWSTAASGGERVTLATATSSSTPPASSRARSRPASRGWRRPGPAGSGTARATTSGSPGGCPSRTSIYPVPERDGLGTHLTLDLAGRGRFGPDTEWIEGIDYSLDPRRGDGFYRGDPALLAGAPRRGARPGLYRHPPQALPRRRPGHRLPDRGRGGARHPRPRQPLRHREPRPHRLARHRRGGAGARRRAGRRLKAGALRRGAGGPPQAAAAALQAEEGVLLGAEPVDQAAGGDVDVGVGERRVLGDVAFQRAADRDADRQQAVAGGDAPRSRPRRRRCSRRARR